MDFLDISPVDRERSRRLHSPLPRVTHGGTPQTHPRQPSASRYGTGRRRFPLLARHASEPTQDAYAGEACPAVRLRMLHESAEARKPRDGCRGKRTPYSTLLSSVYSTPHESHETAALPMPLLRLSIRCWVGGMGMLQSPHDFFTFSLCQESKGVLVTAIVLRGGG
jgi:hypothetical protein